MEKRRWKKTLSLILSAAMIWGMSGVPAFAEEPATPAPVPVVESEVPLVTDPQPETKTCTCTAPCAEGSVNAECPVCLGDWSACALKPEEPQPEDKICTCTSPCAEGSANTGCPVCSEDWSACASKSEVPPTEDKTCTCTSPCAEGSANTGCLVCSEDWNACAPKTEVPTENEETKALIEKLPSLEEYRQWQPTLELAPEDEGYQAAYDAAVAAHRKEVEDQVKAVREAYDSLSDAQRAVLDPAMVEKLTALEGVLAPEMRAPRVGSGTTKDDPLVVPKEGMVIKNGTYYGISKTWFEQQNPSKGTLYVSLSIPITVSKIANDAFRDNFTYDKKEYNAVTKNDELGSYKVVSLDFSNATNLEVIDYQAALGCTDLTGDLDLSETKVETLGKMAFSGCTGLTGVILPSTLKVLGDKNGSAGSVFNGCTGLKFVRTAGGNPGEVFELPDGLEVIGKDTFKNCFAPEVCTRVVIPESVRIIGSQAFYNADLSYLPVTQIEVKRTSGFEDYDPKAFKFAEIDRYRLVIFPNSDSWGSWEMGGFAAEKKRKTYPVILQFQMEDGSIQEQTKLYGQSIRYELGEDGIWVEDARYILPQSPEVDGKPGYRTGWQIYGSTEILTINGVVDGWPDDILKVTSSDNTSIPVFTDPIVKPTVNGEVVDVEGNDTGFVCFNLKVPEYQIGSANPPTIGVQVEHPLAGEGDGKYRVYFEYRWRDVKNNTAPEDGPPILEGETDAELKITSHDMLRYDVSEGGSDDYYIVEIYGYYQPVGTRAGGKGTLFYKSWHGAIGVSDINTVNTTYRLTVQADNTITPPTPGPDEPGNGGSGRPGSSSGGSSTYDPQAKDPDRVQVSLEARKLLDGKTPGKQEFTFTLTDEKGKVVRTAENKGGKIVFDSLALLPGTYRYTMEEVNGSGGSAFGYDDTVYKAEVFVYTSGGKYTAMVSYYQDGKELDELPTFRNTTAPAAPGTDKENPITGGGPAFPAALTAVVSLGAIAFLWRKRS